MEHPETPDYGPFAEQMQQAIAAALAQVDALNAEALKMREAAADELAAAREKMREIEDNARQQADAYAEKHRHTIREEIRREIMEDVVKALIMAGRKDEEIQAWLAVPADMITSARGQSQPVERLVLKNTIVTSGSASMSAGRR